MGMNDGILSFSEQAWPLSFHVSSAIVAIIHLNIIAEINCNCKHNCKTLAKMKKLWYNRYNFDIHTEDPFMLEALLQFALKLCPKAIRNLFYRYESALRYCYYGAWTTLISALTKLLGQWLFGLAGYTMEMTVPNLLNTTFSWICAVSFAFVVNKKYVFMSKTDTTKELLFEIGTFVGARVISYFMELGIMWLTTAYWKWNYLLMTILVQFIILAMNYIFSKLVVFRHGTKQNPDIPNTTKDIARSAADESSNQS